MQLVALCVVLGFTAELPSGTVIMEVRALTLRLVSGAELHP